jgi:preprotein translocase subunit SecY
LISEFGIGNGLSIMIFAGIIASAPGTLRQAYTGAMSDTSQVPMILGIFAFTMALIYLIVYVTEAERPVPINQTKVVRAGEKAQTIQTFLPIKLNQAGVIPIIFAISILMFPQMIYGFLSSIGMVTDTSFLATVVDFLNNQLFQGIIYFILVFLFTFFYTAVTFDPKEMAENLQKAGNFVPGIRPGEDTEEFFGKITTRVTFIGAVFLGLVAVLPMLIGGLTGLTYLGIGGTSLLIVVSVGIDLIRKINAQISVREYLNSVD